jgi:hypothetical protein
MGDGTSVLLQAVWWVCCPGVLTWKVEDGISVGKSLEESNLGAEVEVTGAVFTLLRPFSNRP